MTGSKTATSATESVARVDDADWGALAKEVNAYGCALTRQLLTPEECRSISTLHDQAEHFRSTIDMARYRFGQRSIAISRPRFRNWWRRCVERFTLPCCPSLANGHTRPWPDSLDAWLDMCHAAGRTKPAPILLRYGENDWNALHRDLYGDLVFPFLVHDQAACCGMRWSWRSQAK